MRTSTHRPILAIFALTLCRAKNALAARAFVDIARDQVVRELNFHKLVKATTWRLFLDEVKQMPMDERGKLHDAVLLYVSELYQLSADDWDIHIAAFSRSIGIFSAHPNPVRAKAFLSTLQDKDMEARILKLIEGVLRKIEEEEEEEDNIMYSL